MTIPLSVMRYEFASFWLRNPLQKMDKLPYAPYLAPCEFWPFPKLKNAHNGQRFADIPYIHCNVTTLLRRIPENDFQEYFQQ
jgi:hypothetical protein